MNMRPITKKSPYFKFILPGMFFGILALFAVRVLMIDQFRLIGIVFLVVFAVFVFAIFKAFVWDLVDEVYDSGDALILRKGGLEQKVRLEDITNLDYSPNAPPSATIWTRTTGPLGSVITFRLPATFNPFSTPKQITDLQERIYQARRRAE